MPDFERIMREVEIDMEPTEDGKRALRKHFKMEDRARWRIVKVFAFIALLVIIAASLI